MTLAVTCKCGSEVVFWIDGEQEKHPTETCDDCGRVYRMKVTLVGHEDIQENMIDNDD